jgi:hypothetical protein
MEGNTWKQNFQICDLKRITFRSVGNLDVCVGFGIGDGGLER